MKNKFILPLLIFCIGSTVAISQTKNPPTPKKSSTSNKTTIPKTTVKKVPTSPNPKSAPSLPRIVEEKKGTTVTKPNQTKTPSTTTTIQSSGPLKGKKSEESESEKLNKSEVLNDLQVEEDKKSMRKNNDFKKIKLGIRAEVTQAITFESEATYDVSPGINIGFLTTIPLSEKISIQPELLFSLKVRKVESVKNVTDNITVPVTVNFNLGHGNTKFLVSPGVYANYLLNSSNTTNGVSVIADLMGVDKFFYGIVLGLGVKINHKFLVETRTFHDLKINQNKDILTTIGIGYIF